MNKKQLFKFFTDLLLLVSIGLMVGCTHDSVYDPDRDKTPLPDPSEVFGFEMRTEVGLYVNYDSPGIQALIEVYDENPLSGSDLREKKAGVEALYKIYTDENGKFEGKMNIPAAAKTVFLYTGNWGLPACVELEVKEGAARYDLSKAKIPTAKARTRANGFPYDFKGEVPYTIDSQRALYSLCKWGDWGNLEYNYYIGEEHLNAGYVSTLSAVGSESIGEFSGRLKKFLSPHGGVDNSPYIRDAETINLRLLKKATVDVVFVNRDAEYNNTFGYYYYKTNTPVDVDKVKKYIIFPNVAMSFSVGYEEIRILKCGDKVRLKFFGEDGTSPATDEFPEGYSIGWFIYADGYDSDRYIPTYHQGTNEIKKNASLITSNDTKSSCITLNDKKSGKVIIGVEDGANKSYCDLLFYAEVSPEGAVDDPNRPDIDDPDQPDEPAVETTSGTLAFEDIWPGGGDYDMNDVVVEYQRRVFFGKDNKVTKIEDVFTPVHDGAEFVNAFAYQIEEGQVGAIASENGVRIEQNTSSVIVCENVKNAIGKTSTISRTFEGAKSFDKEELKAYNPYIIVKYQSGQQNRTEVHLPKHKPTSLVDANLIGTEKDLYYVDRAGAYPFAIDIPIAGFKVVSEKHSIDSEYPDFKTWADSKGVKNPDWYKNFTGTK